MPKVVCITSSNHFIVLCGYAKICRDAAEDGNMGNADMHVIGIHPCLQSLTVRGGSVKSLTWAALPVLRH